MTAERERVRQPPHLDGAPASGQTPALSEALDELRRAYHLLDNKMRWTQGEDALDANGEPCEADDDVAVCWCAGGAIFATANRRAASEAWDFMENVAWHRHHSDTVTVNDKQGYRAVRTLFRQAIRAAEAGVLTTPEPVRVEATEDVV